MTPLDKYVLLGRRQDARDKGGADLALGCWHPAVGDAPSQRSDAGTRARPRKEAAEQAARGGSWQAVQLVP